MKNVDKLFALVFLCFLINAENVRCLGTIGFDVHHRYSDTVKDFLGDEGLPEKGMREYYHAMAHRDHFLKARRLAGGTNGTAPPPSNASFLTFSGGNDTFRLRSLGFLHYSLVTVGTPGVIFLVALDTGSDLFWLPCDCTNCARSFNLSSGNPFDLNIYSPSNSTTSSLVPCTSPQCIGPSRACATRRNQTACAYQENYISANTSSTGLLVDDILHLGTEDTPQNFINANITLGCGIVQTGSFLTRGAINGLLGLGMDNISVPSILANKGLIGANSLSMCFGPDGLGRIEFGYKGTPDQKSTPFNIEPSFPTYNVTVARVSVGRNVTNVTFTAIFDSGTSFTLLSDPAYSIIGNAFNSLAAEPRYLETNPVFEYCYQLGATQRSYNVPFLNLTMGSGDRYSVTDPTIVIPRMDGGQAYCLGLLKSEDINIIGQNFMTGYRIVFDRDEMVLGWKESDCTDSIISTGTQPVNNSTAPPPPPSSVFPGATSRNRTVTPPSPPPGIPLSGSNAAHSSSTPTIIIMAIISISFHHFMVLYA